MVWGCLQRRALEPSWEEGPTICGHVRPLLVSYSQLPGQLRPWLPQALLPMVTSTPAFSDPGTHHLVCGTNPLLILWFN